MIEQLQEQVRKAQAARAWSRADLFAMLALVAPRTGFRVYSPSASVSTAVETTARQLVPYSAARRFWTFCNFTTHGGQPYAMSFVESNLNGGGDVNAMLLYGLQAPIIQLAPAAASAAVKAFGSTLTIQFKPAPVNAIAYAQSGAQGYGGNYLAG